MSHELQGLLDRIQREGIEQSEQQKEEIISEAKKNAEAIIQRNNMEAEAIIKTANEEVKKIEERSKATIKQAARDIAISLETELLNRLKRCIKDAVGAAMTQELISDIIKKMVEAYIKKENEDISLQVILSQKDIDELNDSIKISLAGSFKNKPEILKGNDFSAGVKISFNGSDVFFDFSDATITDIICEYVGPRLTSMIKGESK
jgi:V/A-type H+-transporting ATPase subunit E